MAGSDYQSLLDFARANASDPLALAKVMTAWQWTSLGPNAQPGSVEQVVSGLAAQCGWRDLLMQSIFDEIGVATRSVSFFDVPFQTNHVATEFLIGGEWVFFDATFGLYFADLQGNVLSIAEARAAWPKVVVMQSTLDGWLTEFIDPATINPNSSYAPTSNLVMRTPASMGMDFVTGEVTSLYIASQGTIDPAGSFVSTPFFIDASLQPTGSHGSDNGDPSDLSSVYLPLGEVGLQVTPSLDKIGGWAKPNSPDNFGIDLAFVNPTTGFLEVTIDFVSIPTAVRSALRVFVDNPNLDAAKEVAYLRWTGNLLTITFPAEGPVTHLRVLAPDTAYNARIDAISWRSVITPPATAPVVASDGLPDLAALDPDDLVIVPFQIDMANAPTGAVGVNDGRSDDIAGVNPYMSLVGGFGPGHDGANVGLGLRFVNIASGPIRIDIDFVDVPEQIRDGLMVVVDHATSFTLSLALPRLVWNGDHLTIFAEAVGPVTDVRLSVSSGVAALSSAMIDRITWEPPSFETLAALVLGNEADPAAAAIALTAWQWTSLLPGALGAEPASPEDVVEGLAASSEWRVRLAEALFDEIGIESRQVRFGDVPLAGDHTAIELLIDGKWMFFDPTYGVYFTKIGSDTPLSIAEVRAGWPNVAMMRSTLPGGTGDFGSVDMETLSSFGRTTDILLFEPQGPDGRDDVVGADVYSLYIGPDVRVVSDSGQETAIAAGSRRWVERQDVANNQPWSRYVDTYDQAGRQDIRFGVYDAGNRWIVDWDQASQNVWKTTTYNITAQGLFDYSVQLNDDGTTIVVDNDQDHAAVWTSRVTYYTTSGAPDFQTGVNDNGTRWTTNWDRAAEYPWQLTTDTYDRYDRWVGQYGLSDNNATWIIEFDRIDAHNWSRRTTYTDAMQRLDYIVEINDDGSSVVTDYDQLSQTNWSRKVTHYTASGALDRQSGNFDDGRTWTFDWDQDDQFDWRTVERIFNASGQPVRENGVYDDGGTWVTNWDVAGVETWQSRTFIYDASLRWVGERGVADDGSAWNTRYDRANAHAWTRITDYLDPASRLIYTATANDDGSSRTVEYDHLSTQDWSVRTTDYLASGNPFSQTGLYDNGGRWTTKWDVQGLQTWLSLSYEYDASNRWVGERGVYDNGGWWITRIDAAATQPWAKITEYFGAAGFDYSMTINDNGSYVVVDRDQLNQTNWTTKTNYFTAAGKLDRQSIEYDDGARWNFDWDQDNTETWTSTQQRLTASGQPDYLSGIYDDGRTWTFDWDQNNEHPWSTYQNTYAANGALIETVITWDLIA